MREILFRGKEKYTKSWAVGSLVNTYDHYTRAQHCFIVDDDYEDHEETEVLPETVGQYTGLTDKNGKKIFEGDIVEGHCHSQWSHRLQRCVVEYDRDTFIARHYVEQGGVMRYYSYKVLFSKDVVVIGNIHDNPELLKGE